MRKDKTIEQSDEEKNQREKGRIQNEMAIDRARPRCRVCFKYTDRKTSPQCPGHGDGGGGGGGGDSGEKASKDDASMSAKLLDQTGKIREIEVATTGSIIATQQPELVSDIKFNPDVISELLSKKILVIDNDTEKGILTIKLQCDPNVLSAEQRTELKKYINAILNELNEFKKENSITSNCHKMEQDKDGNIFSLSISIPIPDLYDAFIQRLANKYLLPIQNLEQQAKEKMVYEPNVNHFNPTPCSTKPTPSAKKKSVEEESKIIDDKKSSNDRHKSPFDVLKGLKPKGWELK